jgi:hypothetical protein
VARKFELDGNESVHAAISIALAGPPTHQEAQQKALKLYRCFKAMPVRQQRSIGFQIRTLPVSSEEGGRNATHVQ